MIAQNDALRDESLQFSLRLAKLDVDVQLKEYSYMPHGFLNYNAPILGMREEANETIHQCARWLREILDS
jgi:acetyl esterase/lipase